MRDYRFGRWVRATWLGWTLGLLLTIVAALAGDVVGVRDSQALVGIGMGAGVGLLQARALCGVVPNPRAWLWSCVAGLAAPFLVFDLARAAGLPLPFSLYVSVALGGLAAGLWQAVLLCPVIRNAWLWALGSVVGWSLAAASASVADRLPRALALRGLAGAGMYLAVVLVGGLILGLVTGLMLVRLERQESAVANSRAAGA